MSSTKVTIREQILRRLSAGNPSVASKVHPLEIDKAVEQVLNGMLRVQHLESLQLDETIPAGNMLAFYENIPVVAYNSVSKCTLPAMPVTLVKGMGVFSIRPHAEDSTSSGGGTGGTTGGSTGGGTVMNYDYFTYDQLTGVLTFAGTGSGSLTRLDIHNVNNPSGMYVNGEGMQFSVGPFSGNTTTIEYFTPGDILIKWQQIAGSPLYTELTPYRQAVLTVNRLSRRRLKVQIKGTDSFLPGWFTNANVYNINGEVTGQATSISEIVSLWNSDPANQSFGTAIGWTQFPSSGEAQYFMIQIEPVPAATAYPIEFINVDLL